MRGRDGQEGLRDRQGLGKGREKQKFRGRGREKERQRKIKKEKGKGNERKREKRERKRQMKKRISGRLPGAPVARKPPSPGRGKAGVCVSLSGATLSRAAPTSCPRPDPRPQQHQPSTFGQERLVPHNFLCPPSGRSLSLWPNL